MKNSRLKPAGEVAARAYAIWEAEGRPHGKDNEHWLRAETEIAAKTGPVAKVKTVVRAKPAAKSASTGKSSVPTNGATKPVLHA